MTRGVSISTRRAIVFSAMVGGGVCGILGAQEVYEPESHGIDRYEQIWKKSPFIVETTVIQQSDGLEKQYALTGLAEMGGKPVAFLLDRRSLERVSVAQGDETKTGLELVSVAFDPDPRQSKATIRLGDKEAAISYDPTLLVQVDQGSGPPLGAPPPPPPPPPPTNRPPTPNGPAIPQVPHNAAVIPGAPVAPPAATQIIRRRNINVPTE